MLSRILFTLMLVVCAGGAEAAKLKLANGDVIHADIVEWAVGHVVIEHPQLGQMRIALQDLDIETAKPPSKGWFDTSFMRGWKRRIDIGLNGKTGNSENFNFTLGTRMSYEDEFRRWRITGRYFLNTDEDGTTDNNARFDISRDWLFPGSRFFVRTAFRYQFDEFEAWKHRTVFGVGPGYHLVRREDVQLDFVVGPSFTREFGDVQREQGEVFFTVDFDWQLTEKQSFSLSNNFFLGYAPDAGEWRNFTKGEYSVRILEDPQLSFNIGVENEYESTPDPGDDSNDLKYFMGLGIYY